MHVSHSFIISIVTLKETPTPKTAGSPYQDKKQQDTIPMKDLILNCINKRKLRLEAFQRDYQSFTQKRDKLISGFIMTAIILTVALFFSSPSLWFPRWYALAYSLLLLTRVIDYSQKKWQFYLIDFCYIACIQIVFFLLFMPDSFNLGLTTFAFGAGFLNWGSILLGNSLTTYRLDSFFSLWLHTIPSMLAYSLRWGNERSVISYTSIPITFTWSLLPTFMLAAVIPHLYWVIGYYLFTNKVFKSYTEEGKYMTLPKYLAEVYPQVKKGLEIFGSKYKYEAFILYHITLNFILASWSYFCFFYQTLHTIALCLSIFFPICIGAQNLINDLAIPRQKNFEQLVKVAGTLS